MKKTLTRPKIGIKAGDMVVAITGDDAGSKKAGKVLRVFPAQRRAVVEGLNLVKKTLRKSQDNPQGGIIDKEAAIDISNLRLADAAEPKTSRKKSARKTGASAPKAKKTEQKDD